MKLQSLNGQTVFEGRFTTIRRAVESAIQDNVNLAEVNLRGAMLRHACLDGANMRGACLWGAQLSYAQLCGGDFTAVDFRATQMKDACLAESTFTAGDFRGAYLKGAIVRHSVFDHCQFSCPSIFTVPWEEAQRLTGAVYWHKGEIECPLSSVPVVISGLPQRVVMMERHILVGTQLQAKARIAAGSSQNGNRA